MAMIRIVAFTLGFLICSTVNLSSTVLISQYVETNSGTVPKGIELWNNGPTIDFSVTPLTIWQGSNGGSLSTNTTISVGVFSSGSVWVIGTSDIGTYLDTTFGAGTVNYTFSNYQFNGDDSLQVQLAGVVQDTFGIVGTDPGSSWSGNGVSTANQNIELINSITVGDTDGWSDPSERFLTVSTSPASAGGLSGFGVAPVPEPSTVAALAGLAAAAVALARRRRRA